MTEWVKAGERVCNVMSDIVDFRDRVYEPSLVNVSPTRELEVYLGEYGTLKPVLRDQGAEGSCTGFALATVAHYLLRTRENPDAEEVSPRMFYEMAKRYDDVPGDAYEGSSARAAMKGWQKHGVCSEELWRYKEGKKDKALTQKRVEDALKRPLGAYCRVNHKDLVAMHCALTEVGILYATSIIHDGWDLHHVNGDTFNTAPGEIPFREDKFTILGGHAFAIVGYNQTGFWIQNSWGEQWGRQGFGLLRYEDWLTNGMDVWVARLGVPVNRIHTRTAATMAQAGFAISSETDLLRSVRPHIIRLGNDGRLLAKGPFGSPAGHIETLFEQDIPRITKDWKNDKPLRLLIYAHGGLVKEEDAVQRVSEYRQSLLAAEVYPIAFIWRTGFWETLGNILQEATGGLHMAESVFSPLKDMLLERLDDTLERLARPLGRLMWGEMKENAERASTDLQGGARLLAQALGKFVRSRPVEIHVVGHSAGSIILGHMLPLLQAEKVTVKSGTLWAPACTMKLFDDHYVPALQEKQMEMLSLFTLTEQAELDDHCANLYHKSLLYLVSNSFEERVSKASALASPNTPLLGMAKFLEESPTVQTLREEGRIQWVAGPNTYRDQPEVFCESKSHGAFDNDSATVQATLVRILNPAEPPEPTAGGALTPNPPESPEPPIGKTMQFRTTKSSLQKRRRTLS